MRSSASEGDQQRRLRGADRPDRRPRRLHPDAGRACPCCSPAGSSRRSAGCSRCRAGSSARGRIPAATAERKLREKTGVALRAPRAAAHLRRPGRDPRGWLPSVAYMALVPPEALRRRPAGARGVLARRRRAARSSRSTTRGSSTTGCGACARGSPTRRGSCASAAACCPSEFTLARRPAAVRGAARRAGRRRQLPPRRARHRACCAPPVRWPGSGPAGRRRCT